MKRGYFITYTKNEDDHTGIGNKIRNQIACFNSENMKCTEYSLSLGMRLFVRLYRLPFMNIAPIWKYNKVLENAEFIYFRRPFIMNGYMRKVLRHVKQKNNKVKIVMELPTYPYDAEIASYHFSSMLLWKDRYNRNRLRGCIDRIATLTDDTEIFGIPTIRFKNGIDFDTIRPRKVKTGIGDNDIHMCAVAMFSEWHGYERIIEGMREYYGNGGQRNIHLHFVGSGDELNKYKELVTKYQLGNHVVFHGMKTGEELEEIYNLCDLSLGSFGMYKKGIDYTCELKSREALARGIPYVAGCDVDVFTGNCFKYFLKFSNDDRTVSIEEIIKFYNELHDGESEADIINNIRSFGLHTVDMRECMKSVVDYFISGK